MSAVARRIAQVNTQERGSVLLPGLVTSMNRMVAGYVVSMNFSRLTADIHGNIRAHEGVTRCECGSKYWEDDQCVDCGEDAPDNR